MEIKEINKVKENKMSMNVLVLESVGSCIDTNNVTHPLNEDGTPDMYDGMDVHIGDCNDQWFGALSSEDLSEMSSWVIKNNKRVGITGGGLI
jgi:hypothetical protein